MIFLLFFFFFSSRRRHTRCSRDWSSDVCSSDLISHILTFRNRKFLDRYTSVFCRSIFLHDYGSCAVRHRRSRKNRSEERRVGKECRYRRSPYHYKNNRTDVLTAKITST